jgi:hypothetical protein
VDEVGTELAKLGNGQISVTREEGIAVEIAVDAKGKRTAA